MIQYYNTEAEYAAALKSATESQVSRIGENNAIKYDGRNVVVGLRSATTGAIVALDSVGALHFIPLESEPTTAFLAGFTTVGVVAVGVDHKDYRGKVVIVNKANASKMWSAIYSYKLTGYTLDGTDRSGKLDVYSDASNHAAYTIEYNASTAEELVAQLNTYFQANAPFTTQNWRADADASGNITLTLEYTFGKQASASGSTGFALTANLLPEIPASSACFRMNGQRSGEGTISNMERALTYFKSDLNNATYNPKTDVTTPVRSYPICKPGYLGTSQYSEGDHCAALRAIYGPGEAGWLKFMESFLPVRPTQYGPMGDKATYGDGLRNTYIMAGRTFTKQNGTTIVAHPAADYCADVSYNHPLLKKGAWQLPDMDTLVAVLSTVKYNAVNNKKADPINKALDLIGGSAVSNGSFVWSGSRYSAGSAWCSGGYSGCLVSGNLCYAYLALPVALLDVSEANS